MGIKDILKNSFLEQNMIMQNVTITRILLVLLITFLTDLFITYVYRKSYKGVLYTKSYSSALIMTSLVTSLIIIPISSNLTLSLGMVGALSIVRFRTAIKDPMDIAYMFWGIAVGLTNGAGYYLASIFGSLLIGGAQLYLTKYNNKTSEPYIMIIRYNKNLAMEKIEEYLPKYSLKSHTYLQQYNELTIEIGDTPNTDKIQELDNINDVLEIIVVKYNGDYVS